MFNHALEPHPRVKPSTQKITQGSSLFRRTEEGAEADHGQAGHALRTEGPGNGAGTIIITGVSKRAPHGADTGAALDYKLLQYEPQALKEVSAFFNSSFHGFKNRPVVSATTTGEAKRSLLGLRC